MNREGVLRKIKALLAKTVENGCTEAEYMSALAIASAMKDAYEVTDADLCEAGAEGATIDKDPAPSDPLDIKRNICMAIGSFCDCQAWRQLDAVQFCGLRVDVEFARWLLDTLDAFVRAELARYMVGCVVIGTRRRRMATGFAAGCADRIGERLYALADAARRAASKNSRALVVVKTDLIQKKLQEVGIELQDTSNGSRRIDDNSYSDGREAAERASFGRPVDGPAAALRLR